MQPGMPQNTRLRIESWLESFGEDASSEPQAKRARCRELPDDAHLTYTTQYNTLQEVGPQTPPLTDKISMASGPTQTPRPGARKRGPDEIEEPSADVDDGEQMLLPLPLNHSTNLHYAQRPP
jgi:hypothetical protein